MRDKEIVLDVKFIFSRYDLLESKDAMSAPCLGFTWQVANVLLVPHLGTSEDGGRGAERERVNRLSATRRGKQPGAAGRPWTLARRGWHAEMRARRHLAAATTHTQGRLPAAHSHRPQRANREASAGNNSRLPWGPWRSRCRLVSPN